mmetsp:Transcript_20389/g.41741  ORF Transcript_20389/g.41741 Transcript_20389/m.41741 type:complete len:240 (-) Transcript_20389:755-1474(-)
MLRPSGSGAPWLGVERRPTPARLPRQKERRRKKLWKGGVSSRRRRQSHLAVASPQVPALLGGAPLEPPHRPRPEHRAIRNRTQGGGGGEFPAHRPSRRFRSGDPRGHQTGRPAFGGQRRGREEADSFPDCENHGRADGPPGGQFHFPAFRPGRHCRQPSVLVIFLLVVRVVDTADGQHSLGCISGTVSGTAGEAGVAGMEGRRVGSSTQGEHRERWQREQWCSCGSLRGRVHRDSPRLS